MRVKFFLPLADYQIMVKDHPRTSCQCKHIIFFGTKFGQEVIITYINKLHNTIISPNGINLLLQKSEANLFPKKLDDQRSFPWSSQTLLLCFTGNHIRAFYGIIFYNVAWHFLCPYFLSTHSHPHFHLSHHR